jgi:RNA polymerase subunit RPABC4/transcription elongation factor Spt4
VEVVKRMDKPKADKIKEKGIPLFVDGTKPEIDEYPLVKLEIFDELIKYYPLITVSGNFAYVVETVEVEEQEDEEEEEGAKGCLRVINIENSQTPFIVSKCYIPYPAKCIRIATLESTTIKCGSCGKEVNKTAKFCGYCGKPLTDKTANNQTGIDNNSGKFLYIAEEIDYIEDEKGTRDIGGGLRIMDVSDPANPQEAGYYELFMLIENFSISGNNAYILGAPFNRNLKEDELKSKFGLRIIDISDPTIIIECGFVQISNSLDIFIDGKFAYIAGGEDGLIIVDISNPFKPDIAVTFETPDSAKAVFVQDNMAYVGGDEFIETNVIEVTDDSDSKLMDEDFIGGYNEGGLCLIDVSNPHTPRRLEYYTTGNTEYGKIFVSNKYAFITDMGREIKVLDISNPYRFYEIGKIDGFRDVHLSENHAYLISHTHLGVIDLLTSKTTREVEQTKEIEDAVAPLDGETVTDYAEGAKCENCGELIPADAPSCPTCETKKEEPVSETVSPELEDTVSAFDDDISPTLEDGVKLSNVLQRLRALKSEITVEDKKPILKKKKAKDSSKASICEKCGELIPADAPSCPTCEAKKEEPVSETASPEQEDTVSALDDEISPTLEDGVYLGNVLQKLREIKTEIATENKSITSENNVEEDEVELAMCGSCGELNPANLPACPKCGASFTGEYSCPVCNCVLDPDDILCPNCGTKMASGQDEDEE